MGNCFETTNQESYKPIANTQYDNNTYSIYTLTTELINTCHYCKQKKPIEVILYSTKNKTKFYIHREKNKVFDPKQKILNNYIYVCPTCLNSLDIAINI